MSITAAEVRYIAELARLRFTPGEEARLAVEMSRILEYMELLGELDTADVPPMSHVLDLYDVFRPDRVEQRISRAEALRSAPEADDAYFRVPRVIE